MNPWKLATLGIVTVLVTALSTGVTTAYLMRPAPAPEPETVAPASARYAVATTSAPRAVAATPAPLRAASVRPVAMSATASDCDTGGERAWKIAKPGLIGTLLGAGVGAAGGAIANGGKSAGKGAIVGGLAGAALGAGYGAYKTKQECGTIFGTGNGAGFSQNGDPYASSRGGSLAYTNDAPRARRAPGPGTGGITVYNAGSTLPR
jgi:hypothetical protein